ncbi:MAG: DMT family transporter [Pseudomonadota bacterium]
MENQRNTNPNDRPFAGILFIIIAMTAISINDMLFKHLSGAYPLHQLVLIRSLFGIVFTFIILQFEGGWRELKTDAPFLHLLRGIIIVISNMTFFTALAVIPLAEATALFFVAPLLITLLAIPILGEKVGFVRLGAIAVGFLGVLVMVQPWATPEENHASTWVLLLPVVAAFAYALNQVLTRKLGVSSKASAMAIYIQSMFIVISLLFYLFVGDGRMVDSVSNESLRFLFRAWIWPPESDLKFFLILGMVSAVIGYSISQAYRVSSAATVAPFEYTGLPLAIFWGWLIWGELPGPTVQFGILLIAGAGLFVFWREQQKQRLIASGTRVRQR